MAGHLAEPGKNVTPDRQVAFAGGGEAEFAR